MWNNLGVSKAELLEYQSTASPLLKSSYNQAFPRIRRSTSHANKPHGVTCLEAIFISSRVATYNNNAASPRGNATRHANVIISQHIPAILQLARWILCDIVSPYNPFAFLEIDSVPHRGISLSFLSISRKSKSPSGTVWDVSPTALSRA